MSTERLLHPSADLDSEQKELLNNAIARSAFFVGKVSPKQLNKALKKIVTTKEMDLLSELHEGGVTVEGLFDDDENRLMYPATNITALATLLRFGEQTTEHILDYAQQQGIDEENTQHVFGLLADLHSRVDPSTNSISVSTVVSYMNWGKTFRISIPEEQDIHKAGRGVLKLDQPFGEIGASALIGAVE